MAKRTWVPLKEYKNQQWGDLTVFGHTHEIIGETVKLKDQKFSFAGGHRVRLYSFKKNVHWRPVGAVFDISDIPVGATRKQMRG